MALTDDDKAWITGLIRDMETKILTEFHKWASPNEARQRAFRAELQAVELDLDALKDRVTKLEGQTPRNT